MNQSAPRVALICDYALSYLGGAQTALIQEAAALAAAGAPVVIISPSSDEVWSSIDCPGVQHLSVPARCTLPGLELPLLRNGRRLRRRLTEVLTAHRIDIVHLHSEFGLAAAASEVGQRLGLPVVHTVHTFFWQSPAGIGHPWQQVGASLVRRFHALMTRRRPTGIRLADRPLDSALRNMTLTVAAGADRVISPSAHQAARLRTAGLPRVAVVPNTVAAGRDLADRPAEPGAGPLRIVWIGRCEPEKRLIPFVEAVRDAIRQLGPDRLSCVVVGDGSQLDAARRLADGTGITFLGRQPHERVPDLLADAQLLALTSVGFDNQPMTVVEAVMALRGVLYCDPALTEGLDGPGILMPADEAGMARTLIQLAGDPGRVAAASKAAVTARQTFTPASHAGRLLEVYRDLRPIRPAG